MIGAHQTVVCVPEAPFLAEMTLREHERAQEGDRVWRYLTTHPRFVTWGVDSKSISRATGARQAYEELVLAYAIQHSKASADYVVDHTPTNVRHIQQLRNLFPTAKFIHMIRDGRAVAASLMKVIWGPSNIRDASNYWLKQLAFGLAAESSLGSDWIQRVRYEDLVTHPEQVLPTLCGFLGIDFHHRMCEADGFDVPEYTKKDHRLVGQPLDTNRAEHWQRTLTTRQVEICESIMCDMLPLLGYSPLFKGSARAPSPWENMTFECNQLLLGRLFHRFRRLLHARKFFRTA
jgi:hypothetical protein